MSIKRLVKSFATIAKSENLSHTQRRELFDLGCAEILHYLIECDMEEEDGLEMSQRLWNFANLSMAASRQFNEAR
jgi:hypothetical protein